MEFPKKSHRAEVRIPSPSEELAEFCGIMLGDGGIAAYQVRVTLHANEEQGYGLFVTELMTQLFGTPPQCYRRKNCSAIDLVLSRIEVVEFLINQCGLKLGNKVAQQADIPIWILENPLYRIACMRGLFDTDGSVFTHRYLSKGKYYSYPKLGFTSVSLPLLQSAKSVLDGVHIKNRYGSRSDIRIESAKDVQSYFERIQSHNPKHLMRYAS